MPDEKTRLAILKVHTKRMPLSKDVNLEELAKATDNYTGAELENLCREAGLYAIKENKEMVDKAHFMRALNEIRPAIPKELAEKIKQFKEAPENMYR